MRFPDERQMLIKSCGLSVATLAFVESNPVTPSHEPFLVVQPEAELRGIAG